MSCLHEFEPSPVPHYERCSQCGTYRSTAADDPALVYDSLYWMGLRPTIWEQCWNVDMHLEGGVSKNRFVLDRIEVARGAALDVGCAPGRLLFWLQHAARFRRVVGIDPSATPEQIRAAGCFDGELLSGFFPAAAAGLEDASFDFISALDVFEHVPDPDGFLRECARLLKPGGQLLLMLPLADGLPAGSRFFDAAEHVYLHSIAHVRMMLDDAGFEAATRDRWAVGHDSVSARKAHGVHAAG